MNVCQFFIGRKDEKVFSIYNFISEGRIYQYKIGKKDKVIDALPLLWYSYRRRSVIPAKKYSRSNNMKKDGFPYC